MPRYINSDTLNDAMYHEAFVKDSDFQKWDGGCWIRYKLFENVLKSIPTVDAVEVVRCKYCKHLSTDRIAPEFYSICRKYGVGKPDDGFCDEAKRKETEDGCSIH